MKAIALLSGGLDSVVSCYKAVCEDIDIIRCLFFDYGQKALEAEKKAAVFFSDAWDSKLEVIDLPFLKNITGTSLVNSTQTPQMTFRQLENDESTQQSMLSVWVPNRNGLFINIAASYCDSLHAERIIVGFNQEEAATFPDNTKSFLHGINSSLEFSTLENVKVIAPYIDCDKTEIVRQALDLGVPVRKIWSCYHSFEKMCGSCESCIRFKRALDINSVTYSGWFLI
ncbi:MAG: 7-cyano-7-deazaguanine synthase QueC [Candidatus Muiribacteriaceae bacterium]